MFDDINLNQIQNEKVRELNVRLLNMVEKQAAELRESQTEIQRLHDEVNRLKEG